MTDHEVDVRSLRKPDKHPTIFGRYAELGVGESFVLVNNHDPKHLRDEFEIEHPRSYSWEYLTKGPTEWRIRIGKLASAPLPHVLVDAAAVTDAGGREATGIQWKLQMRDRDLDSNIVRLGADEAIEAHNGPELDVLIHILGGSGQLVTELDTVDLAPGLLVWLPRRSRRAFMAGSDGLCYLTVHQRRQGLRLEVRPPERES